MHGPARLDVARLDVAPGRPRRLRARPRVLGSSGLRRGRRLSSRQPPPFSSPGQKQEEEVQTALQ